jgi:hypothetical protein
MARALAAVASGNDRKSATSAAARAASTSSVIDVTCSVMMGTTRMPAIAAMAEPRAQFKTAIRFGDTPMAEAWRSLSDTASVARPNWLERYSSHNPIADTTAMPSRMKRSTVVPTSPHSVTRLVGSQLATCRAFDPYRITTPAWIVTSTPSVAMTRTSELARCSGRMMTQCVSTPSSADNETPKNAANRNGMPCWYCNSHCRNTPAIAVAPNEKFNTPVPR